MHALSHGLISYYLISAGLDGEELVEDEERQLVLDHDHVAADVGHVVEQAVVAEDGVVGRVVVHLATGACARPLAAGAARRGGKGPGTPPAAGRP